MAHELSIRANGHVEHAYTGDVGWHGLGNKLEAGASIEEWQKAAGMDWRILRSKVRFNTARDPSIDDFIEFPDRHVLFRSDSKAPLSVVSDSFKVVQPAAVLEFFRDLAGGAGFALDTAGVLFGGKRFWALAKIGEDAYVADKRDAMKGYLLLSTSCDGSMATEGRFTSTRVVCNNTLGMARADGAKSKVTHRSVFDPTKMKNELGVGREMFATFMNDMRRLADTRLLDSEMVGMTTELFHPGAAQKAKEEFLKAVNSKPVTTVSELVIGGRAKGSSLDGVKGTAYGWLQGITEYVDRIARARSADNRQASAWFGPGDALKTRALEMALAA